VTRCFRVMALLAPLTVSAAPGGMLLEVDGGGYERADTPVVFPLPQSLANERHFLLTDLST
jgi:hypothetical protein